jgi:hypothetical protein
MRRFLCIAVVVGALMTAAPGARAAEAGMSIAREGSILWTIGSVSDDEAERVVVKILTPRDEDGDRSVFQKCTFVYSGAGDYRCGIDISKGSVAAKLSGRWVARVSVDGDVEGRTPFSTR